MRKVVLYSMLLSSSFAVHGAEYFDERFAPGYQLLDDGEFDKALEAFNELKTETPESALVDYSIASTYYKKAVARISDENKEDVIESLTQAKERFEELIRIPELFLKENAPFNSANCSAQIAKLYDPKEEYSQRVIGLRTAIEEYDKVLRVDPGHVSAKKNRDHLSYLLKKMLQDPPPDQKSPDEGDGGENENEGEEEKEGQDPSEGENEEKKEGEEDDAEGDPEEDDSENDDQSQDGEQQQSSQNGKAPEEANIEAILDSLEEVNKEEQKNLRRAQRAPQVKGGKWW
jgi:tetratricopeptide (TPR) repeat protein